MLIVRIYTGVSNPLDIFPKHPLVQYMDLYIYNRRLNQVSNLVREGTDFNSNTKNVNKEHEANNFSHEGVDEDKNWNNFTFQLPFT